jgi:hypothetical protein
VTLGDLSNLALVTLQQPNVNFVTGGAASTGPNWQANQQYSQGLVEFAINEGYKKMMGDIEAIELFLVNYQIPSIANTYIYPFPPTGYAQVSHVARIYYKPFGLLYTLEFRPGTQLTSWANFQDITGQGFLRPYSFGTQPTWASIDPLRQNIFFYPGSARSGDTISVQYAPIPTPYFNVSGVQTAPIGCPILVNETDTPVTPYDTHMAIYYYAMFILWQRARQMDAARASLADYKTEIADIKFNYTKIQHGDTIRIEPFMDRLSIGGRGEI